VLYLSRIFALRFRSTPTTRLAATQFPLSRTLPEFEAGLFACLDPDRFDRIAEATLPLLLEQLTLLVHQTANSTMSIRWHTNLVTKSTSKVAPAAAGGKINKTRNSFFGLKS
jgi:hypothetical protein